MDVYADTYGLTRLRLLVALCELWLGAGVPDGPDRRRPPAGGLAAPGGGRRPACWRCSGWPRANPDGLIADRNVARYEQTDRIDTTYLSNLSADAVPALDRLDPAGARTARWPRSPTASTEPDDWRGWSYGREHAREMLRRNPPERNPALRLDLSAD